MPDSTGVEVGRISVKVSPDTSKFREELKRQLKKEHPNKDVEVDADTTPAEKTVKKATDRIGRKNRINVDVETNADTVTKNLKKSLNSLDRFQRRSLGDLGRNMADIEKNLKLTGAGEGLRKDLEKAEKSLAKMINAGPPVGSKKEIAAWRAGIREQLEASKQLGNAEGKTTNLGVSDRDFALIQRLGRIRKIAADREAERVKGLGKLNVEQVKLLAEGDAERHRARMAYFAEELTVSKREHGESVAYVKQVEEQAKAEKTAEAARRKRVLSDPFNKKAMADLQKAYESLNAAISTNLEGERERSALKERVTRIQGAITADIPVDLDTRAVNRAKIQSEISAITAAVKAKIKVDVDIDKAELAGAGAASMASKFSQLSKKFIPSFGSGVNPAGYALILGAITLVAAPLIGLVSTALLTLPGLIAFALTPIAAMALGMDGLKKAAETLKQPFEKLKEVMTGATEQQFTPVFEKLKNIFPILERSLPGVTAGVAKVTESLVDMFNHPINAERLEDSINRIGTGVGDMAPGVGDFGSALNQLVRDFTLQFPGISDWFNQTALDFKVWVGKMSATGELDSAFSNLGAALQQIGGFFTSIADKGIKFLADDAKMDGFLRTLQGVSDLLESIVDLSSQLAGVWDFLGAVLNPLDSLTNSGPGSAKQQLLDAQNAARAKDSVEGLAGILGGVGATAEAQVPGVDKLFNALIPPADGGPGAVGSYLDSIAGTNPIPEPAPLPTPDTAAAEAELAEYQGFVDIISAQVRGSLQEATTGDTLPAPNFESFKAAWTGLVTFIQTASTDIGTAITNLSSGISVNFSSAFAGLGVAAQGGFNQLKAVATTAMTGVVDAVTTGSTAATEAVRRMGTDIVAALQAASKGAYSAGVAVGQGMALGIAASMGAAVQAARNLAAAVDAAGRNRLEINSPAKVAVRWGASIGEGFTLGMEGEVKAVKTAAGVLAAAAQVGAEGALEIQSPSKVFERIGGHSADGLALGLENGFAPVLEQAKSMADAIAAAFASGNEDPTSLLAGYSTGELDRIDKVLKVEMSKLEARAKGLTYESKRTGDAGLKTEAERLRMLKSELSLQREMLGLATDFNDEVGSGSGGGEDPLVKAASGLANAPVDFAKATGKQFMSDLGISGDGFISNAITEGISYIFQIGSVDEALSIKDREQSKNAQSMMGR